ncbi:MAG: TrmH family RNA methyltransferase [Bacteriovoracaceae bacterium]|jgi:tRNA G18 (ribose-2'-O)-methylase SpoU|nr:TrmH family RNA methyltransferase [Bacteriovoracaceae bacterium]
MNKDFSQEKLLSFSENKIIKILYDLAGFIEKNQFDFQSKPLFKLKKYHDYLKDFNSDRIQKLNKEFSKVKSIGYQYQIYLMHLERALGQTKKDYQFLIKTEDNQEPLERQAKNIICILDSVRSAHNVGAIFRNAECFQINKIILTGLSATPDSVHVSKTAMGGDQLINWEYQNHIIDSIKELKSKGYTIYGIETAKNATYLENLISTPEKIALIFGHEQFGISYEVLQECDQLVSIHLVGRKNSLNVAVSCGIVFHQVTYSGVQR